MRCGCTILVIVVVHRWESGEDIVGVDVYIFLCLETNVRQTKRFRNDNVSRCDYSPNLAASLFDDDGLSFCRPLIVCPMTNPTVISVD